MAVRTTTGWFSIARGLAFLALILVVLSLIIPGTPGWLLAVAVILLCVAVMVG